MFFYRPRPRCTPHPALTRHLPLGRGRWLAEGKTDEVETNKVASKSLALCSPFGTCGSGCRGCLAAKKEVPEWVLSSALFVPRLPSRRARRGLPAAFFYRLLSRRTRRTSPLFVSASFVHAEKTHPRCVFPLVPFRDLRVGMSRLPCDKKRSTRMGTSFFGRNEVIRTPDLLVPNQAHYQAVLHPEG